MITPELQISLLSWDTKYAETGSFKNPDDASEFDAGAISCYDRFLPSTALDPGLERRNSPQS
jgi:hypothetical protein